MIEPESIMIIEEDGTQVWRHRIDGHLHRPDGPAVIYPDGTREYWLGSQRVDDVEMASNRESTPREREDGLRWINRHGATHRLFGLPAIIGNNGDAEYWFEGQPHRVDGPAIDHINGNKRWYFHGVLHRPDGPAVELPNGRKEWYRDGVLHRDDGPAVTGNGGYEEYWIHGTPVTKQDVMCHD